MSTLFELDPAQTRRAIDEAVQRSEIAVLTMPTNGGWCVCKTRFLPAMKAPDRVAVLYPTPESPDRPIPDVRAGQIIGVSFRRSHRKCVFTGVVVERDPCSVVHGSSVDVLSLQRPERIQELQRRAYYRAPVPPNLTIAVRVRPARTDDTRTPLWTARLADLSAGGMRVLVDTDAAPKFSDDDPVVVEFQPDPGGGLLTIDAIVRHGEPERNGSTAVGLQFVGLEATDAGRATLRRLARSVLRLRRLSGGARPGRER